MPSGKALNAILLNIPAVMSELAKFILFLPFQLFRRAEAAVSANFFKLILHSRTGTRQRALACIGRTPNLEALLLVALASLTGHMRR